MKTLISSLFLAASTLFVSSVYADTPIQNIERKGCVISKNTVCKDAGTKTIQGQEITKDCWATETVYQCSEKKDTSDCDNLAAIGCTTKSATDTCVDTLNGECIAWERTYSCAGSSAGVGNETCGAVSYCEKDESGAETCYDMSYSPDQDMIPVVTLLEAGRQAGVYGDNSFFNGEALRCRLGAFGIGSSCCFVSSTPKGRNGEKGTANSVMMSAVWAGAKYGYNYVKALASPYVHDAFMAASSWLTGGATAAASAASGAAAGAATVGFNFSYMGFGYATAGAAPAGAIGIGNAGFYFSPWGFAAAVAVYVITQVLMCTPDDNENKLAALRSSNLCRDLGDYCAKKTVLGICRQRKRTFCCWNSTLARLIAVQGRAQLGRGFGSAKNPDCRGFNMDEFKKLDLGKMDFSEFYSEVKTNTLGIEGSGVAKEDQDFWKGRAETRFDKVGENLDTEGLSGNFAENRNEMKARIDNTGTNAVKHLDVQYDKGTAPTGNINVSEDENIKNDPYLKLK